MGWFVVGCVLCLGMADDKPAVPLVEKYLHWGPLAKGEQVLTLALAQEPRNDQLRFGLGVVQVFRGVERLGQALYEHGVKSEHTNAPFLRLPVPPNPDPTPISYPVFRRILDDFRSDLLVAEKTLAGITDDNVKLPLQLAYVRLDLIGDGKTTDTLASILRKLMRQESPSFLKDNPKFLVTFDRGDVAWLRAYCHLLSAMIDIYLSVDTQSFFDESAGNHFVNPKTRSKNPASHWETLRVVEPLRLHHFRQHMLQVCALNRETWRYIRAERDDDHEWLPNPQQQGVLGLPVRDDMIDAWLGMVGEFDALLKGEKLIPVDGIWKTDGKGLNLQIVLDDPPAEFDFRQIMQNGPQAKYLTQGPPVDVNALLRVAQVFNNSLSVAYAMWFN